MKRKLYRWWSIFHRKRCRVIKIKFITWFNSKHPGKYCWADCVSWAYSPTRFNPFKLETSRGCKTESTEPPHELCYCGEWNKGTCWALLSKEEQERISAENKKSSELSEPNLPF